MIFPLPAPSSSDAAAIWVDRRTMPWSSLAPRIARGSLKNVILGGRSSDIMAGMLKQLREYLKLPNGWDSYEAAPPSEMAVHRAEEVLVALDREGLAPRKVAPSVMGGIGMTVREGKRRAFVECYNDGLVYVMLSDGAAEPSVHPVRAEPRGLSALVEEIRQHVYAQKAITSL